MPKWQIVVLAVLAMTGLVVTIVDSKNSFMHKFLDGECSHDPPQPVCKTHRRG